MEGSEGAREEGRASDKDSTQCSRDIAGSSANSDSTSFLPCRQQSSLLREDSIVIEPQTAGSQSSLSPRGVKGAHPRTKSRQSERSGGPPQDRPTPIPAGRGRHWMQEER
jgi:hypothetical protein